MKLLLFFYFNQRDYKWCDVEDEDIMRQRLIWNSLNISRQRNMCTKLVCERGGEQP